LPLFNVTQGLEDWDKIRAVKQAVSVFANGNVFYQSDINACLKATGADGVMSAEGQLYNPALFAGIRRSYDSDSEILERHPRHADLALEYLSIVRDLKSATSVSTIKGHFKIMRPGLIRELDLREMLGRMKINQKKWKEQLSAYILVCEDGWRYASSSSEKNLY
jgi:tRNA-dihydrouridine synthase 1